MNISYIAPKFDSVLQTRKRVAAYARVSSGKDESLHSLASQISFYSAFIQRNHEWVYAGVYADEALTGTKETRPEFQRMMQDCREGKIDLILTKSLSRFARNTVTTLAAIRELKEYGVDVWFERENIHSLSGDGEFMITILSSFAQEESLSASENQKWKIRKNFSEGISTTVKMLGYRQVGESFVIVPEEAEIVKLIFWSYLSGMGVNAIMKMLIERRIPTKRDGQWHESEVTKILKNEKYMGDLLLQKTFVADHISKKKMMNTGQIQQFYVEDNHEAIIDRETFLQVQEEMKRRSMKKGLAGRKKETYEFSGKIICECCGKKYRRKITANGKIVWVCATFSRIGKKYCSAKQIPEEVLKELIGNLEYREIRIPCDNTVKIILQNGEEITKTWEKPSRSESWTPEMREKAKRRKANDKEDHIDTGNKTDICIAEYR